MARGGGEWGAGSEEEGPRSAPELMVSWRCLLFTGRKGAQGIC